MTFTRFVAAALAAVALWIPASVAWSDTYVHGHTRKDGTYVQPHYRSSPNSSYNDNWSVRGNTNPYTGKSGTLPPTWNDRSPEYNRQHSGSQLYRDSRW